MRIPHRDRLGGKVEAVGRELNRAQEVSRKSHIHAHASVIQKGGLHQTALGMQIEHFSIVIFSKSATADVLCHAASRVAAHGRFGTIGIKDAHFEIDTIRHGFRSRPHASTDARIAEHQATVLIHRRYNHHTISTDTEATVAKLDDAIRKGGTVFRSLPRFIQHEIVAQSGPF